MVTQMKAPWPNFVDPRNTSTLTFDCYGTLVDWERGLVHAFRRLLGERAASTSDSALIDAFLKIDMELISGPFQPYSDILANAARRVGSEYEVDVGRDDEAAFVRSVFSCPLFPETLPALQRLSKRFRLAIISNIDNELLEGTLKLFNLDFSVVVTSEEARCYKPAEGIFKAALSRLGEIPNRVVHIAEGLCEAAPARRLGMGSVWVRRSERSDDGSGARPDLTVQNLTAFVDIVERAEAQAT